MNVESSQAIAVKNLGRMKTVVEDTIDTSKDSVHAKRVINPSGDVAAELEEPSRKEKKFSI
jgi:hypothetical protein